MGSLFFSIFLLKHAILHFLKNGKTNNNLFKQLIELNRELDCGKFNHSNGPNLRGIAYCLPMFLVRLSHGPTQFGSSRLPLCCLSFNHHQKLVPSANISDSWVSYHSRGSVFLERKIVSYRISRDLSFSTWDVISCQQWI